MVTIFILWQHELTGELALTTDSDGLLGLGMSGRWVRVAWEAREPGNSCRRNP